MAAKTSKPTKNVIFEDEKSNDLPPIEEFSDSKPSTVENVISVILGLAVVFVIGAMIVNVIRNRNAQPTPPSNQQAQEQAMATISAMHTVQAGDTLWSIAEKYFKDGFKYPEIEKANNFTKDTKLEKGMQLVIPKLEGVVAGAEATKAPTPSVQATIEPTKSQESPTGPTGPVASPTAPSPTGAGQTSSASTDKKYTVVRGDSLWDISVKQYGNGYRWVEIAKLNKLANPSIIHAGNVLIMP